MSSCRRARTAAVFLGSPAEIVGKAPRRDEGDLARRHFSGRCSSVRAATTFPMAVRADPARPGRSSKGGLVHSPADGPSLIVELEPRRVRKVVFSPPRHRSAVAECVAAAVAAQTWRTTPRRSSNATSSPTGPRDGSIASADEGPTARCLGKGRKPELDTRRSSATAIRPRISQIRAHECSSALAWQAVLVDKRLTSRCARPRRASPRSRPGSRALSCDSCAAVAIHVAGTSPKNHGRESARTLVASLHRRRGRGCGGLIAAIHYEPRFTWALRGNNARASNCSPEAVSRPDSAAPRQA